MEKRIAEAIMNGDRAAAINLLIFIATHIAKKGDDGADRASPENSSAAKKNEGLRLFLRLGEITEWKVGRRVMNDSYGRAARSNKRKIRTLSGLFLSFIRLEAHDLQFVEISSVGRG